MHQTSLEITADSTAETPGQLAFVLFGYDQGVFGGIVNNADWLETFGHPGTGLEGIIVSIYNLGAYV